MNSIRVGAAIVLVSSLGVGGLAAVTSTSAATPTNVIVNGDMEQGSTSPWFGVGPKKPSLTLVSNPVHSGNHALRVALPVLPAGSGTGACNPVKLTADTAYSMTAWVRGDVPASIRVGTASGTQTVPAGSVWNRLTYSWTQGSTAATNVCVVSNARTTRNNMKMYVDDVTVTTDVPTPEPTPTTTATPAPTGVTKVLTFIEENHSLSQMQAGMPYLFSQAQQYGYADHYTAITHPSLPNYLAMVGGSTFGVSDNASPASHPITGPNVFHQAITAGYTAKSYQEDMPGNCYLGNSGRYAVKHNPWAYWTDDRTNCGRYDVPTGTTSSGPLRDDIVAGSLPNVGEVTPNLDNDAHDAPLATADAWIKGWLELIYTSPDWQSGHLAVIVTADEDDSSSNNTVLTVVIHPSQTHHVVTQPLTHYSWTRYMTELTQTPCIGSGCSAQSLGAAFGLP